MEISHSPWPWLRSDATALTGYANMMIDDDDDDDDDDENDTHPDRLT